MLFGIERLTQNFSIVNVIIMKALYPFSLIFAAILELDMVTLQFKLFL